MGIASHMICLQNAMEIYAPLPGLSSRQELLIYDSSSLHVFEAMALQWRSCEKHRGSSFHIYIYT